MSEAPFDSSFDPSMFDPSSFQGDPSQFFSPDFFNQGAFNPSLMDLSGMMANPIDPATGGPWDASSTFAPTIAGDPQGQNADNPIAGSPDGGFTPQGARTPGQTNQAATQQQPQNWFNPASWVIGGAQAGQTQPTPQQQINQRFPTPAEQMPQATMPRDPISQGQMSGGGFPGATPVRSMSVTGPVPVADPAVTATPPTDTVVRPPASETFTGGPGGGDVGALDPAQLTGGGAPGARPVTTTDYTSPSQQPGGTDSGVTGGWQNMPDGDQRGGQQRPMSPIQSLIDNFLRQAGIPDGANNPLVASLLPMLLSGALGGRGGRFPFRGFPGRFPGRFGGRRGGLPFPFAGRRPFGGQRPSPFVRGGRPDMFGGRGVEGLPDAIRQALTGEQPGQTETSPGPTRSPQSSSDSSTWPVDPQTGDRISPDQGWNHAVSDARQAASGGPSQSGAPPNILAGARQAARGGPGAVARFMAQNGFPMAGNWCGEFAAAVMKSNGLPVPRNPAIASNWRNWGNPTRTPRPGDIAVRRGVPTGHTGSHVTTVERLNPNGTFSGFGGNQRGGMSSTFQMSQYEFRTLRPRQSAQLEDITLNPHWSY